MPVVRSRIHPSLLLWVPDHTGAIFRPSTPDTSVACYHHYDLDILSRTLRYPTVFPLLMLRLLIGMPCHVKQGISDLLITPAGGKFRLARPAGAMPMTAAVGVAIKNVRGAFLRDPQCVQCRPLLRVHRVPAGSIRPRVGCHGMAVTRRDRLAVRGAEHLVILRTAPMLGWARPWRGGGPARVAA